MDFSKRSLAYSFETSQVAHKRERCQSLPVPVLQQWRTTCGQHNGPAPVLGYSGRPVQATSSEPAPVLLPAADWPQSRTPAEDHPSLGLQWRTRPSCALQRRSSTSPSFQWQTSPSPSLKRQTSPDADLQWRTSPSCVVLDICSVLSTNRKRSKSLLISAPCHQVIIDFNTVRVDM